MRRISISPRADWQSKVEAKGLLFHTTTQTVLEQQSMDYRTPPKVKLEEIKVAYWDESAYYELSMAQVNELEAATNNLHSMCLHAVQHIIDKKLYDKMAIPAIAIPLIERSWNEETPAIYGRFDLSYDGKNPPKMLEYNADTPTSLPEAAVVQWYWQQELFPKLDQFNSIHERLIAKWKELKKYLKPGPLHFSHMDSWEDFMNASYMRDTAHQAGIETQGVMIEDIGWDDAIKQFVDYDQTINNVFKLYPWEWLFKDAFAQNISLDKTFWIEPPWKMLLSNKAMLPILWELFGGHPNLLPAYFKPLNLSEYVKKPFYSREGANITIKTFGDLNNQDTPGVYGQEGFIYQAYAPLPSHDGNYPVIGSWVIDGESAGIGIRESDKLITDNFSRFIPHVIKY